MTPETSLQLSDHSPLELDLLLSHAIIRDLDLQHTSAIVIDAKGSLLERQLRSAGASILRYIPKSILEQHGLWTESWLLTDQVQQALPTIEEQPRFISDGAYTQQYKFDVNPGLIYSPPDAVYISAETFAEATTTVKNLSFIVINDAEALKGLLSCPHECLARKPLLWFTANDIELENVAVFIERACELGYHFIGPNLSAIGVESFFIEAPRYCIGIPPEVISLPTIAELINLIPSPSSNSIEASFQKMKFEGFFDEATYWIRDCISNGSLSLPLDGQPALNWHPVEGENDYWWRWMGPKSDAKLLIPLPTQGCYILEIRINSLPDEYAGSLSNLFINGKLLPLYKDGIKAGDLLRIPLDGKQDSIFGWAEVMISMPYTVQVSDQDPRYLGLSIDHMCLCWKG